jgi:hypothetical protein
MKLPFMNFKFHFGNILYGALFIASCINNALGNEIQWPIVEERVSLGTHLWEFPSCIGFIDDTLIEICKPW